MRRHREERRNEGLILNSLVDVALSLVIGFMVAMPLFFETGIFVSAPGAARAAGGQAGTDIKANVFLTDDGRILLNEAVVDDAGLAEMLPKLLNRSIERRVIISAQEQVVYDRVMKVMDLAKQSGAADVALLRTRRTK